MEASLTNVTQQSLFQDRISLIRRNLTAAQQAQKELQVEKEELLFQVKDTQDLNVHKQDLSTQDCKLFDQLYFLLVSIQRSKLQILERKAQVQRAAFADEVETLKALFATTPKSLEGISHKSAVLHWHHEILLSQTSNDGTFNGNVHFFNASFASDNMKDQPGPVSSCLSFCTCYKNICVLVTVKETIYCGDHVKIDSNSSVYLEGLNKALESSISEKQTLFDTVESSIWTLMEQQIIL